MLTKDRIEEIRSDQFDDNGECSPDDEILQLCDWALIGVAAKSRTFSHEPTARGDDVANYARMWYEANRESWWERLWRRTENADEFMIGFVQEVRDILESAK